MGCKSVANKPWWSFVTRDRVTRYLEPAIPLTERERGRENESLPGIDRHGFETTLVAKRNTIGLVPCFRVQIIARRLEDAKDNEETGGRERC